MQSITINLHNMRIQEKVLHFLKPLKNEGVEIISQEDFEDFRDLSATRHEDSISFESYLKNED